MAGSSQFDEASHFGDKAFGYDDHGLAPQPECSFIFCDRFILSLLFVVLQNAANPVLIPAGGKAISSH
jgi:hypothetical protein